MATLKSLLVKLGADSGDLNTGLDKAEKKTSKTMGMMTKAIAAISFAAIVKQVAQFTLEATKLAARVETLGVVTRQLGKNAGYTEAQIDKLEKSIQKKGITTQASRQALAKMMQAELDLAKATDLARLAQDAAVISGTNSSEAFSRLIDVISTGNVRMARTMGLQVDFNKGYEQMAAQLGKTKDQLTAQEKAQSRTNSVLQEGTQIAGTYEAAMETVGKQLESTPRYLEEFTRALGDKFIPALGAANTAFQEFLKTSTLLLEWGDRLDDYLDDHQKQVIKTADSYEDYRQEMIRSLSVAGKITKAEEDFLSKQKELTRLLNLLKDDHGDLTNEKLRLALADGIINEEQALLLEGFRNQEFQIISLAKEHGILSEAMFAVQQTIMGVAESTDRTSSEFDSLTNKLGIQASQVAGLEDAYDGLVEKELRTLQVEAILAGDYALATSIGEKIEAIEAQEEALEDLIELLDDLDGKVITADVIISEGAGGALSTLTDGAQGVEATRGTIEAFGQTFSDAEIRDGILYVRGAPYSTEKVPGFSRGADFIVPPGYPNDSFPMMVESGERVQVTSAGAQAPQQLGGGQSGLDEKKLARMIRDSLQQVLD